METMRLTTRLTQVMAWTLAPRAVHSEELTPEEGASRAYQLSGQAVCLDKLATYPKNCASYCIAVTSSINGLAVWKHRLTAECRRLKLRLNGNLRTERPI